MDNKTNLNINLKFLTSRFFKFCTAGICASTIVCTPLISWAGDPFRQNNPRNIPIETETAFKTLFEEGNYTQAREYLLSVRDVPDNDPLFSALIASLAYTEEDWKTLDIYAKQTTYIAKSIVKEDPLRGNLYLAVGNFLEGASEYQKKGPVAAIAKLQLVLDYFDKAEAVDSQDPEFNLIKGYLNLLLAVHLPFSNPQQAIDNLQTYASPAYLVNRGIAVAYRDLEDYDLALKFVDKAIESTPLNPELYYLKGQILKKKGRSEKNTDILTEALENFDIALTKVDQLPERNIQKPLRRERRQTVNYIEQFSTTSSNK